MSEQIYCRRPGELYSTSISSLRPFVNFSMTGFVDKEQCDECRLNAETCGYFGEPENEEVGMNCLASFGHSGNTWVKSILHCVEQGKCVHLPERRYIECHLETVMKTHDLGDPGMGDKIVYLVRDPRSVYYSTMNHAEKTIGDIKNIDDMLRHKHGNWYSGNWSEHVIRWVDVPRVMVIKYEDMCIDAFSIMRRVCDFLEMEVTAKALREYVEFCSFANVRAHHTDTRREGSNREGERFFWRGSSDAWYEMPFWMVQNIESIHHKVMLMVGYKCATVKAP